MDRMGRGWDGGKGNAAAREGAKTAVKMNTLNMI
jgi:hypothetical protein